MEDTTALSTELAYGDSGCSGCPTCRGYTWALRWALMPKNLKRYYGPRRSALCDLQLLPPAAVAENDSRAKLVCQRARSWEFAAKRAATSRKSRRAAARSSSDYASFPCGER